MAEPYIIPDESWVYGIENAGRDITLNFQVNVGATVINAFGLEAEIGVVRVLRRNVEICFTPSIVVIVQQAQANWVDENAFSGDAGF